MKINKRIIALGLAAVMCFGLTACGGNKDTKGTDGTVKTGNSDTMRVYIGGGETITQIETILDKFNQQSDGLKLENTPLASNQTGYQMLTVMYNAGDVPPLMYLEANDFAKISDKLLDLSDMPEVALANEGTLDDVTFDGKILGLPGNIQGYGLMYSREVLNQTMGEDFDPSSIKTRDDLKNVFEQIQAKGVAPVAISPYDWSLVNHYLDQIYAGQADNAEGRDAFVAKLKDGTSDLINNSVFNDYMDTFDLMKEYNYYKENPLETVTANTVDSEAQLLATGQTAFWFMGNWAAPSLRTLDETGEYGYIPVPLNDTESPNFNKVCTLVPGYYAIDKSVCSKEQQENAKKVIEYLVSSEDGKDYTVNQCKFIPAYTNNDLEVTEPIAKSISDYSKAGNAFPMYTKYPTDHFDALGIPMQKYLTGEIDRNTLASEIETYWQKQK